MPNEINIPNGVNFAQGRLIKPIIDPQSTQPNTPTPLEGQQYFDTVKKILYYYNGSIWVSQNANTAFAYYRQTGSTQNRWYIGGVNNSTALTTGTPVANTLYTVPFISNRDLVLDRLGFNVTGLGVLSNCRVGIYNNTSDTNLYPSSLVIDGGDFGTTVSTGIKSTTINVTLNANKLYWFVMLASGTVVAGVRAAAMQSVYPILGIDSGLGTALGVGWTVAQTYGALPSTYPASGAVNSTGSLPVIAIRIASAT